MNERIREIAEQARQYAFDRVETSQEPTEWNTKYYNAEFDQKFAELVIRECATVIHKRIGPKSALDVLEHFGVEE